MRFVRVLIVLGLILSVVLNVVLFGRTSGRRAIFSVNGAVVSKKTMDDFLEQQAGPEVKRVITEQMLTDQAAQKAGVAPTPAEVDEVYNTQKELNWQFASAISRSPWHATQQRDKIRLDMEQNRLRAKDVKVSDAEMTAEYNANPYIYDTPNKARTEFALVFDAAKSDDIEKLMKDSTPDGKPQIQPVQIMGNYQGRVTFLGDNYVMTITQPFGTQQNASIFNMKPGDVMAQAPPPNLVQQNVKRIIVRLLGIVPGHKADPNDPKIKEQIRLRIALSHSRPWQEYLSELWSQCRFESDDPNDRKIIEQMLFPNRTDQAAAKKE